MDGFLFSSCRNLHSLSLVAFSLLPKHAGCINLIFFVGALLGALLGDLPGDPDFALWRYSRVSFRVHLPYWKS